MKRGEGDLVSVEISRSRRTIEDWAKGACPICRPCRYDTEYGRSYVVGFRFLVVLVPGCDHPCYRGLDEVVSLEAPFAGDQFLFVGQPGGYAGEP
jgi:hypothetical protein